MPMLAVAVFVALVHAAWVLLVDELVVSGNLTDGDSYARLVRVTLLYETGDWFSSLIPRSNAPFGDVLHWTRPFDVVLLTMALPLTPFLGFTKALFLAGAYVSPLLHVLTAVAVAWAAAPLLGRAGACIAGALTASRFSVLGYATAGHGDHHLLFALITVMSFGFFARALAAEDDGGRSRNALAAGVFAAVGVWTGTEAFVFLGLCLSVTGLMWVVDEKGAAQLNIHLVLGFAVALALALLAERGPDNYIAVEFDRISIVHVSVAALLLAFWGAVLATVNFWRNKGAVARLTAGAAGAAAVFAVMWTLFPGILAGPMADVSPELFIFFEDIPEYAPIKEFGYFLIFLGGGFLIFPWAAWRVFTEWRKRARFFWIWLFVVFAVVVFSLFAANWVRWSMYAGIFISIPMAGLLFSVDAAVQKRLPGGLGVLVKATLILLLVMGPGVAGISMLEKKSEAESKTKCDLQKVSAFLNRPRWADRPRTIVTSVNFGNELMYRTGHQVLSTLHHRNASGILDVVAILGGVNDEKILGLVNKRNVDLILLCPNSNNFRLYTESADENILYKRLERGDLPLWIREAEVDPEFKKTFRLFEVSISPSS